MYQIKKRLLSIMCLVLGLMMFVTSCANNVDTPDTATPTPATTSGSEQLEDKVHKLRIMGPSSFHDFVNWDDRENFASWELFQDHLKERNIELEYDWVVPEQYATVIQTRMAGAVDLPDIANISDLDDMTAISLGQNGIIIDMDSAIEQYSDGTINKTYEEGGIMFSKQLTTASDGKRYWIANAYGPGQSMLPDGSTTVHIDPVNNAIRKDWLDELELPIPETVDEWVDALRAFRENDMNGNGVEDEVLLFDSYSYSFMTGIAQWYGLVPDIVAVDPVSSEVTSPWYQEGVKDYFIMLNELANEGIFDVDLVGATDEVGNQRIAENKVSALRSYSVSSWWEELVEGADAVYAILPPLQAKEGVTPYLLADPAGLTFGKFAITKECDDVEGAIKLLDYLASDEYRLVADSGVEGIDYTLDEKGLRVSMPENEGLTGQEIYASNKGGVSWFLDQKVFPQISPVDNTNLRTAEETLASFPNDKQRNGMLRKYEIMQYRPYVPSPFSGTLYALPSEEELDTVNKYSTALKTYSEELYMALILGNESIDDWDKHIEQLKALGLDEMIAVYSDRYERYLEAIN